MLIGRRRLLRQIGGGALAASAAALLPAARAGAQAGETPSLTLPGWAIPQGGSFIAVVQGAGIANVEMWFAARRYQAVRDGGGWLTVIGVGQRLGVFEQDSPGPYGVQANVTLEGGGTRVLRGEVTVTRTAFAVEDLWFDDTTSALLDPEPTQRELAVLTPIYATFSPRRLWDGFFLRPAGGEITDPYGTRRSYNGGPPSGSHAGVDFGAPAGAPVRAAASGRVIHAAATPVRGNGVVIDHGAGVLTGYSHMSAIGVAPGQSVQAGETIGRIGSTGLVTGPHLHWEVIIGGYQVDGLPWLGE